MARQDYFTGDTRPLTVNVTTDGVAANIPSGATVTAAFVNGASVANGPWTASSATSGANWGAGVVVVVPSNVSTPGTFDVEIQVIDGAEIWTRRTSGKPIRVVDDAIA
jgi:hypothetical protein